MHPLPISRLVTFIMRLITAKELIVKDMKAVELLIKTSWCIKGIRKAADYC